MTDLNQLTREQLEAMVTRYQAQGQRKLTLKVGKAGGIAVYGLGQWPTTLYANQWDKVLDMADDIRQFAKDNAAVLSQGKNDPRFAKAE